MRMTSTQMSFPEKVSDSLIDIGQKRAVLECIALNANDLHNPPHLQKRGSRIRLSALHIYSNKQPVGAT